jgi:hypothetical protein
VSSFFEFYRSQTKKIARWLCLNKGRMRRSLGRGLGLRVSRAWLTDVAKSSGLPVVVIGQQSRPAGGTLQRCSGGLQCWSSGKRRNEGQFRKNFPGEDNHMAK